jgi:arylsulfatase A-like enzyme
MNRKLFLIVAILWLIAGACTLRPLRTNEFRIEFDQEAINKTEAFLSEAAVNQNTARRPNIIILMADDLGYYDISHHGNPNIQTKHIDALARQGLDCTRAYATAPSCAPSRAGFITGRYQQRFGFENQLHERLPRNRLELWWARNLLRSHPWKIKKLPAVPKERDRRRQGLPPTEITLAELLKKEGYRTGIIGKWHLGSVEHALPHKRGFDEHFGFYASHSLFAPEKSPDIVDLRNPADWTDKHIWSGQREKDCAIVRNGEVVEESGYITQRFAEEAIRFLEENQDHPFFLYVPFSAPHTPFQAPQKYYDQFLHIDDPVKRIYYAMIAALDDAAGAIHDKVEELGLAENTMIFFLSDNGGAEYTQATDNAPLNGGKITSFDGGLRIPMFVKWKGVLPAGATYTEMVSILDIFATVCAATQTALPQDRSYDGVDLLPYWLGEAKGMPHENLFWKGGDNHIIIQHNWKLLFNDNRKQTMLYDLAQDPFEKKNLAHLFPDKAAELQETHRRWYAMMPGPMWPALVSFAFEDEHGVYFFDN